MKILNLKRLLLIFCFGHLITMSVPLSAVNGEKRAQLFEIGRKFYELVIAKPTTPKKVIIVPRYSLVHSFKNDAREITIALKAPVQGLAFILNRLFPKNTLAQKMVALLKDNAVLITSGALIGLATLVVYKAFYENHKDQERQDFKDSTISIDQLIKRAQGHAEKKLQYRALAIATPAALTIAYLVHKLAQYGRFKDKYRLLLAANK